MFWIFVVAILSNLTHVAAQLLVARALGVTVWRVSIGVGPSLGARVVGGTNVRFALIPLPLIVSLRSPWKEDASPEQASASPADLRSRSVGVRLAVFASGPASILLLALLAAFRMHGFDEVTWRDEPVVGKITEGSPAAVAGIQVGDTIEAINGEHADRWSDLSEMVRNSSGELTVEVQRARERLELKVRPKLSEGRRTIGVGPEVTTTPAPGFAGRVVASVRTIGEWGQGVLETFSARGAGTEAKPLGGPVYVYASSARPGFEGQWRWTKASMLLLQFFIWCLVLPFLDGTRLLFLGVEAVARRPIHPKHERRFNWSWLAISVVLSALSMVLNVATGL